MNGHVTCALATAVGALLAPATAGASTVSASDVFPSTVFVRAAPGEVNDVTVTPLNSEARTVRDAAGAVAGPGCSQVAPTEVVCSITAEIEITLLDGADRADTGNIEARIEGGDGDDVISNGGGDLDGGAGNDVLLSRSSPSFKSNFYSPGHDLLGGDGDDRITGGAADEQLVGGAGSDEVHAGPGEDVVGETEGAPAGDVLDGGEGVDWLDYGTRQAPVTVDLPAGTAGAPGEGDSVGGIENVAGGAGGDTLVGNDGPNVFSAQAGADDVLGRGGRDLAFGGTDGDTYDLGAGTDGIDYGWNERPYFNSTVDSVPASVGVDLAAGVAKSTLGEDRLAGIENVAGTDSGDLLLGDDGDNRIDGRNGGDRLAGRGGNDHLNSDSLAAAAQDGLQGDTVIGGEGDDVIRSGPGNDQLAGDAGDDVIDGGRDEDTVNGGRGTDLMSGGTGFDTVSYADRTEMVVIDANGDAVSGTRQCCLVEEDTVMADFERLVGGQVNDSLIGNDRANELYGGPGEDVLEGGGGDDRLYAEEGNDRLLGGLGSDLFDGGPGADQIFGNADPSPFLSQPPAQGDDPGLDVADYSTRTGPVTLAPASRIRIEGGEAGEQDVIVGVDVLLGGSANDVITGLARPERIEGGPGDDRLDGRKGDDTLVGGAGADLLTAGGGRNILFGDAGADRMRARNRRFDRIDCGADADRGVADRGDRLTACEAVARPRRRG